MLLPEVFQEEKEKVLKALAHKNHASREKFIDRLIALETLERLYNIEALLEYSE